MEINYSSEHRGNITASIFIFIFYLLWHFKLVCPVYLALHPTVITFTALLCGGPVTNSGGDRAAICCHLLVNWGKNCMLADI